MPKSKHCSSQSVQMLRMLEKKIVYLMLVGGVRMHQVQLLQEKSLQICLFM